MTCRLAAAAAAICALVVAPASRAATVANPGPFTATFTGGSLTIGSVTGPLSAATPATLNGTIDANGNVVVTGGTFPALVFSTMAGPLTISGSVTLATVGNLTGTLDPATGAATLTGSIGGTVTVSVSPLGPSGTCTLAPTSITLTTAAPGVAYSQTNGTVTLAGSFTSAGFTGCDNAALLTAAAFTSFFSGSGQLTLGGALSPVVVAPAMTAARLRSFSARRLAPRVVELRWRTASELGVLGFDVYRLRDGHATRLNARLIRALGASRSYRLTVRSARAGDRYRLASVGFDGTRTWVAAV